MHVLSLFQWHWQHVVGAEPVANWVLGTWSPRASS
jgi:hypothetical protein